MSLNKDRHSIWTGAGASVYGDPFESRGLRVRSLHPVVGPTSPPPALAAALLSE